MGLIDSHAHLTFPEYEDQLTEVLERSRAAGVDGWVTIGTDPQSNTNVIGLAQKFENIWAAVGFHPHAAKDINAAELEVLEKQAGSDVVVAIGEIGLDYYYNQSPQEDQKRVFREQLEIASRVAKPVIIHSRDAFEDTIEILDEFAGKLKGVVVHCFGGDAQQAQSVIDRGFYISFTGVVTFKNADRARLAAAEVPIERLMVETDCPFMSPAPMRKQKVNEPALMIHTAAKLAQIKGVSEEQFARISEKNTRFFFGL